MTDPRSEALKSLPIGGAAAGPDDTGDDSKIDVDAIDADGDGSVTLAEIADAIGEMLPSVPPDVADDLEQAMNLIEKHATREEAPEEGADDEEGEEAPPPPSEGE